MSRKPDDWMPLHIGDYLADTTNLTRDQHGAYLLLIMSYWRKGEALTADDGQLAAMAKATLSEWRKIKPVIASMFIEKDGKWFQKRCEEELENARGKMAAKSKAGKIGAKKRWHNDGTRIADASVCDRQSDAPLPSTIVPVSEETNVSSGASAAKLVLIAGKPDWWPTRDRYGRVQGEITDKLLYDVGKAVLGASAGGQITKLKKLNPYRQDWRAAVELILRADDTSEPAAWFARALRNAEIDEPEMPKHVAFPESEYRE